MYFQSRTLHFICVCTFLLKLWQNNSKVSLPFPLRCLVHILRETTVKYSKIRSFHGQCQLDLCRHEVRYGCLREDECFYAHSLVELKVWILQNETSRFVCDWEMSPQEHQGLWSGIGDPSPTTWCGNTVDFILSFKPCSHFIFRVAYFECGLV